MRNAKCGWNGDCADVVNYCTRERTCTATEACPSDICAKEWVWSGSPVTTNEVEVSETFMMSVRNVRIGNVQNEDESMVIFASGKLKLISVTDIVR